MNNVYVTDKNGSKVYLCNYSWTDSEGHTDKCRAPQACAVCGQCSRLDGERELGHCPGHLTLDEHVQGIPGRGLNKTRDSVNKAQGQIREQNKNRRGPKHQRKVSK